MSQLLARNTVTQKWRLLYEDTPKINAPAVTQSFIDADVILVQQNGANTIRMECVVCE
jgi:hypothetical protein